MSLTAFLRTNRDSADAEDELFRIDSHLRSPLTDRRAATTQQHGYCYSRQSRAGPATTTHPDRTVKIDRRAGHRAYVVNFPGDQQHDDQRRDAWRNWSLKRCPTAPSNLPFNVTLSSPNDVSDYWLVGATGVVDQ